MRRLRLWITAGALALLLHGVSAGGAAAQALDLRVERGVDVAGVTDYDFSWVYWWEANGQAYLREAVSDRALPDDGPASRRWRASAVAALVPLLEDTEPAVREQAVVALARVGHAPLEQKLIGAAGEPRTADVRDSAWLIDDPSQRVRCAAWLAMGLLETPRCRAALAQALVLPGPEQAARVAAIGLLSELDPEHLAALTALLTDYDTPDEVKRWVVWAVDRHAEAIAPERRDAVYRWALQSVPSTFVISQVLSSEDYARRHGGTARLLEVIRYYPDVRAWAGYEAIRALPQGTSHGSTPRRLSMETRIAASLMLAHLPPPQRQRDRTELRDTLHRRMMAGNRAGVLDFNRGVDTIAFALHSDATPEDQQVLYDLMRGFTVIPVDEAILLDDDDELTPEDMVKRQSDATVRPYAALAVGLLIRRETEGTALYAAWPREHLDGIELDRLKRRFGERLSRAIADDNEPMDYRAACALALGLTGDPIYIGMLTEELGRLRAGDEPVLGYGLLALAMLGDERAAEPARRYLTRPGVVTGIDDLVGRRASLQALGVLGERGGEDARKTLEMAWGDDPWMSIEVGRTTQWSGLYEALPAMLGGARSGNVRWRVASAMSLGAAMDRTFPSRVEALSDGVNFTMTFHREAPDAQPGAGPLSADRLGLSREAGAIQQPPIDPPQDDAEAPPGQPPAVPATHYPEGWPRRELHGYGNPFLFERLLG